MNCAQGRGIKLYFESGILQLYFIQFHCIFRNVYDFVYLYTSRVNLTMKLLIVFIFFFLKCFFLSLPGAPASPGYMVCVRIHNTARVVRTKFPLFYRHTQCVHGKIIHDK